MHSGAIKVHGMPPSPKILATLHDDLYVRFVVPPEPRIPARPLCPALPYTSLSLPCPLLETDRSRGATRLRQGLRLGQGLGMYAPQAPAVAGRAQGLGRSGAPARGTVVDGIGAAGAFASRQNAH